MAYKGMMDILDSIGPTADVVKIIRPIYNFNFKAGDEDSTNGQKGAATM